MPAKSKSQQRLMGWVRSVQKGEAKNAPKKIKDIAKSMKKKPAKEFAKTKHKGLPEKVKKKKKKKKRKKKTKKSELITSLVKLANKLDTLGLIKEADDVDSILTQLTPQ